MRKILTILLLSSIALTLISCKRDAVEEEETPVLTINVESETWIGTHEYFNVFEGVTVTDQSEIDYTEYLTVTSENCEIDEDGYVNIPSILMECFFVYEVLHDGLFARQLSTLWIASTHPYIPADIQVINEWNFDDESEIEGWNTHTGSTGSIDVSIEEGSLKLVVTSGTDSIDPRIDYMGIPFEEDGWYLITFTVKSSTETKKIFFDIGEFDLDTGEYQTYDRGYSHNLYLNEEMVTYNLFYFIQQDCNNGGIIIELGDLMNSVGIDATIWIDSIVITHLKY